MTLRLLDADKKQVGSDLKVVVNGVAVPTTASLDVNSVTEGTGTYDVDINNGSHDINLTVPKNSASTTYPAHFRVATQDGAELKPGNNVAVQKVTGEVTTGAYDNYYEVQVTGDDAYVTVTSVSGKNTARWDINVTKVGALTSFALGEYEGTIDEDAHTIEVVLPKSLGTDKYGDSIDVILPVIFEQYGNEKDINIAGTDYENNQSFNAGEID